MFSIKKFIWELTQKLSTNYVVSVHWYGYRTSRPYGLGFHGVQYHLWGGKVFYAFVE